MNSDFEGLLWSATNVRTLIPATILMALFAFFLRRVLKGRGATVKNIPFVVLAVLMLALEVIKQAKTIAGGYGAYALPLHFSSVYLFLYPLAHFTRGKFSNTMKSAAAAMSAMSAQGTWLFPMTVFGNAAESYFTDFGAFHTITYHYLIILYLFLFIALADRRPVWRRDAKILFVAITVFSAIAGPAANFLQANYTSFLFNSFPPVEAMRLGLVDAWGLVPAQIVYVLFMYAAILVTGMIAFGLWVALDGSALAIRIQTVIHNAFIFTKRPAIESDVSFDCFASLHLSPDGIGGVRAVASERQLI